MAENRAARRLAAVLATDVVGYSRLMRADEAGTLARLRRHQDELIDPVVSEHRGRIVKLIGDGALVEFASAIDSVRCAAAIQRAMVDRNVGVTEAQRIAFRIGINLGDVIVERDDIYGDCVNVAARMETLAEPGGICISGKVFDEVRRDPALGFADLGEQWVKNIPDPIRAYRVLLDPAQAGAVIDARGEPPRLRCCPSTTSRVTTFSATSAMGSPKN
jgi:adenylate cyclase